MSTNSPTGQSRKEARESRAARAAAEIEALRKKQQRRTILSISGVVVLILVILGVSIFIGQQRSSDSAVKAPSSTSASAADAPGVTVGPASAPHKVIVFEDFLCPYCGQFEKASHAKLAALAAQGKVQVTYRPFVLLSQAGPYSENSLKVFAIVQKTAGNDVAKKYHDLLYANQPSEEGPFPGNDDLVKLAVQAGADKTKVQQGVDKDAGAAWVTGANQAAKDAGVQGTPTILLDGKNYQKGTTVPDLAQNLIADLS